MIKLQNNYTTVEQSKRLLELGVPADSADMYYKQYSEAVVWVGEVGDVPQGKTFYIHEPDLRHMYPEGTWIWKYGERIDLSGKIDELRKTDIPCWSVGRLIEIFELCYTDRIDEHVWYNHSGKGNTIVERVMWDFNDKVEKIDFSKLEE